MRIAIIALGSRGDVQPYIALGKGLHHAGHLVRLVTHASYDTLVLAHGLDFWPVQGDVQAFMQSEEMRAVLQTGNFFAINALAARELQRVVLDWTKEGLAASQGQELLIAGVGGLYLALALAEKLKLPLIQAPVFPFTPTRAFAGPLLPPSLARLGGVVRQLSHHLTRQALWQGSRSADARARRDVLGLPAAPFWGPYQMERLRLAPTLYGFSPTVIPKPADWGPTIHVMGYWFLDSEPEWTPPPSLMDFLQRGSPPLYIGFGSMSERDPEATADLVLDALARTQQRAIVLSGWDAFRKAEVPDTVCVVESIPHDWLFPRVAAVVHHGGAGTSAAGLRAGVPSLVIPFFGDQPFWGHRIAELGVGPDPIPRQKLTAERLGYAILRALNDPRMRQRASALGETIRAEDGVGRAVALIPELISKR